MILKVNKQLIKTILEDGAFSGAGGITGGIGGVSNASGSTAQVQYGGSSRITKGLKDIKPKPILQESVLKPLIIAGAIGTAGAGVYGAAQSVKKKIDSNNSEIQNNLDELNGDY